eukprot:TRINITY_DN9050_c0_g1_i1.p1 TRINITY_DN9050_c0_g1~~TRINITY_DN9050_c0_g1_i1.p1  ORF type:complete len:513 (+),score=131.37 TRINITY_DN9050_c0_g1_i1:47-1540(+)
MGGDDSERHGHDPRKRSLEELLCGSGTTTGGGGEGRYQMNLKVVGRHAQVAYKDVKKHFQEQLGKIADVGSVAEVGVLIGEFPYCFAAMFRVHWVSSNANEFETKDAILFSTYGTNEEVWGGNAAFVKFADVDSLLVFVLGMICLEIQEEKRTQRRVSRKEDSFTSLSFPVIWLARSRPVEDFCWENDDKRLISVVEKREESPCRCDNLLCSKSHSEVNRFETLTSYSENLVNKIATEMIAEELQYSFIRRALDVVEGVLDSLQMKYISRKDIPSSSVRPVERNNRKRRSSDAPVVEQSRSVKTKTQQWTPDDEEVVVSLKDIRIKRRDFKKLLMPTGIDDIIVNGFQNLISVTCPAIGGLQDTLKSVEPVKSSVALSLQAVHLGNHWSVLIRWNEEVFYLCSLNYPLPFEAQAIAEKMFNNASRQTLKITSIRVKNPQDANSEDCGLFALAYMTEIALAGKLDTVVIANIHFKQQVMRTFCFDTLMFKSLKPFPKM